jgi:hypothetical protein
LSEYVVAQAAVLIVPTLGKGSDSFKQKLKAELALVNEDLAVKVKADTTRMTAQIKAAKAYAESQLINLKINELGITKQLTEIRHKYEDLQREVKKGLILDLKITGMTLLPQLAYGLAAANASMVQLAQSAALLPGVLSGVLSSFGALATGLGGVKDAFKEYGDAQENAAQEGLKARNAALNVNNAYRDLNQTVKDAKRSLEDLNAQLRDAPLDEADAIIRVQEARAEAADKAQKSGLQQQKDALNILKAENDLADTRMRNSRLLEDVATANAKGVAGNAAVVDATDRLSKAMDDAGTKATKLSDSLKELSPNAQEFVRTVTGMQGQFTAFRDSVQDRLFDGLGAEIVELGNTGLPVLQRGFSAIAGEINGNFKTAIASLQTDSNVGFIDRILGNTAGAQGKLDAAINPFIDALLRLSAAGSDFLPQLADGLSDVLTRFDNFIVRAEGDGSLEKWMNSGIDALKDLGNSIINIGSMLSSLNDAFTGAGGNSLLGSLEQATSRLAEMMRSTDGQNKLIKFFTEAREQLAKWRPLLDAIPGILINLGNAAESVADIFLPFLTSASQLLRNFPGLVTAVFYAFVLWKNIIPVAKGVYGAVDSITGSFDKLNTKLKDGSSASGGMSKFRFGVGELAKSLGPTLLLTAVTTAATYLGTRLAQAHIDAKEAARRHKEELDQLVTSMDAVTGAAGKATNAVIGGNLRDGVNSATGQSFGNVTDLLIDPNAAIEASASGDLGAALSQIKGGVITPEDVAGIDGGKWWGGFGKYLESKGVSQQTVADAFNGDPTAVERFTRAQNEARRGRNLNLPQGASDALDSVLPGEADAFPTLKDLQSRLPNDGLRRAATAGILSENTRNVTKGGAAQRTANEQDFGKFMLPDGSPLAQFGVLEQPAVNADGGGLITSSKPVDGSALAEQLRNDGVTFDNFDDGKFKVSLTDDAVKKYFQPYATGGLISGPGSGTSDSILARLSAGEYVVNAAATKNNLPLLQQLNGGGLPAFAPGGPVPRKPPPVVPVVPDIAPPSSMGDTATSAPAPASDPVSSGIKGFFETANEGLWKITDGVGNFLKAATGIGETPEGYQETRTATIRPNVSAAPVTMGALSTPFTKDTTRGALPEFVEQAATNIYGGKIPEKPVLPTDTPKTPTVPVKPATPTVPTKSGATPAVKPTGPVAQRPAGQAPAGKTWDYSKGSWVAAPGTAGATAPTAPFVYGAALPPAPKTPAVNDIFTPSVSPAAALPAMMATPIAGQAVQAQIVEGVTSEVNFGAQEAARYGLRVSSGLRPGDAGFHGSGQAGDYSNQVQYGPTTPEMDAFAAEVVAKYAPFIDELIYAGVPNNIHNGVLVPSINMPGSPYNDAQAGYHGDHVHIAWKPGALEQLQGSKLMSFGGSPSNMPLAPTPTGVGLPQLSYAPGVAGALPAVAGGLGNIDFNAVFQNYVKSVQDNWGSILQNLVKNAGSIAMNFLGSFFGIDLSPIMGIANAISGDLSNVEDLFKPADGGAEAGLPADASVAQMLESAEFGLLPPGVQQLGLSQAQAQGENGQGMALLQQLQTLAQQMGAGSQAGYNPAGGAEQWRPTVRRILQTHAATYGITNLQAWEDALVRQIQSESNGNPGADNPTDTNGQGGTQHVSGLLQFLPETFAANNITGGDYLDPEAQIAAAIPYVAKKYGMDASGAPLQIGRGVGYASGGKVRGKGTGMSDSILARVSNGEYIVKASAAQNNMGLLNAINSGVPGFAEGGLIPINNPPVVPPPPVTTPPPPPSPVPPAPMGPTAGAEAGQPTAPAPTTAVNGIGDAESNTLSQVGDALSGIGASVGGATGAEAPAGASPTSDPRSVLGAAPQNLDHNNPAISKGIQAAGSAIGSAVSTAMSVGSLGAGAASPAAGAGASAASSAVSGFINAGTTAASGAVNVLSSLLVGTLSRGGTGGAYGTPLVPQQQSQYAGPSVVNNWNGGVHTSNNEEFYKVQQRRELQNASPMLPRR